MSWNEHMIDNEIFCNSYITSKSAINIIVTHTPIFSTTYIKEAYEPLAKYGVNIFAIDFSCTGKSKGNPKDFSLNTVLSDFEKVLDYIELNFSSNTHVFGNTGIGGIFAQYAVCGNDRIRSFAQFSCANYKDTTILGMPISIAKISYKFMSKFPNVNFSFKEPKYTGYRAYEDDQVYKDIEKLLPDFRKCKMSILGAFIESIVSEKSVLNDEIKCPTLVFKTLHDRYFSTEHFDKYYNSLNCEKKLVEINDVHNSYIISAETFCATAYEWFKENEYCGI